MNRMLSGILPLLLGLSLNAQKKVCLTMLMDSVRQLSHPQAGASIDFEAWISHEISSNRTSRIAEEILYRIPVIVHVVHNGEAVGSGPNLSAAQVQSQIVVLNEDFRKIAGSNGENTDPNGTDTRIEFYLVERAPDGSLLEEPGIDRVNGGRSEWPSSALQMPIETELKPATIWDPEQYFNIWTVNFGGFLSRNLLGYAQFPDMSGLEGLEPDEGNADTDGVVIGYKYFGSSEKGNFPNLYAPFDFGRTTTHETGHWLGLRHIWGDGDCLVDDYVADTPMAAAANYGCPASAFSCNSEDMFQNYMDYTDDLCMNIFTYGQKERMFAVLENSPRRSGVAEVVLNTQQKMNASRVFPNPTAGELTLTLTEAYANARLLDFTGKQLQQFALDESSSYSLNLSELAEGIYLLQLITATGLPKETLRIIKSK